MNKNPHYIQSRAARNLSNRADGAETSETVVLMNQTAKVATGVANHITINVKNEATTDLSLALTPAGFRVDEVVNTVTKDSSGNVSVDSAIIPSSPAALQNAGYNVGAVLHDCQAKAYTSKDGANVKMWSADPTRTLNEFLEYIKRNAVKIRNMEIYSQNAQALASNLNVTFVNPFFKNAVQTIDLSTFFDLYQYNQNRIKIDFSNNELELSDLTLLTCTIPASSQMQFILRFE